MNASLNILIIEIALVLFIIVCVLAFLIWKQKKTRANGLEQLLDNIDSLQDERKQQLAGFLINDYSLDADEAKESGEYMVEAEKQFMQQFVKQQLEQTAVTDFYGNLCELLDQYLYFVPKKSSEEPVPVENEVDEPEVSDTQDAAEQGENKSSDEDDSAIKQEAEVETEVEEEAEPDWGDAFSEAGDEMDADAKEGYESELKKE
jgi:hypothetical protein